MAIVAYYKMNGNSNDASGNGYNGSDNNMTYPTVSGIFGKAANFNGTSSRIVISNSAKGGNSVTISCLVMKTGANASATIYSEGSYILLGIQIISGVLYLYNKTSLTTWASYSLGSFPSKYNHIVYNYNSSDGYLKGFLNGYLIINVYRGGNQAYNTNYNTIGVYRDGASSYSNYMDGLIDEFIVANDAWTPSRIKNQYSYYKGFF